MLSLVALDPSYPAVPVRRLVMLYRFVATANGASSVAFSTVLPLMEPEPATK